MTLNRSQLLFELNQTWVDFKEINWSIRFKVKQIKRDQTVSKPSSKAGQQFDHFKIYSRSNQNNHDQPFNVHLIKKLCGRWIKLLSQSFNQILSKFINWMNKHRLKVWNQASPHSISRSFLVQESVEFYHCFSIESIQTLIYRFERSKLNHSCSLSKLQLDLLSKYRMLPVMFQQDSHSNLYSPIAIALIDHFCWIYL